MSCNGQSRNREPREVRVLQVIEVTFCRGEGTEEDCARIVKRYHDMDGNVLAENDPYAGNASNQGMP